MNYQATTLIGKYSTALLIVLKLLESGQGASAQDGIAIEDLRVEYLQNPLGIDERQPRFSWILSSSAKNKRQSAYRILVADSEAQLNNDEGALWDSDKINAGITKQVVYEGTPLVAKQEYYWKVKVWDETGRESDWSEPGYWSTGLLNKEDWKATWISFETADNDAQDTLFLPASPYLRKSFSAQDSIKEAFVYVSALGLYEISVNGSKVGQDLFTPGWTDYNQRVYYQTYDITQQLKEGENALGAILADGWYSGYIGPYSLGRPRNRELYGEKPALLCQIDIEYEDGRTQTIVSDESWRASSGPIVYADMLMGESYNANLELGSWNQPAFDDSAWEKVEAHEPPAGTLEAYPSHNIRVYNELVPQKITQPEPGVYIFDLGQNFAGYARLAIKGNPNDTIVMRFGEMLHQDGTLMTENLRFARATDTYILKGGPTEHWEPKFTYHGFRYVEVRGLHAAPSPEMITGIAISSNTPRVSSFSCSDSLVNTLYRNIVWTQRSNFMEVPTDSPQRDERLGWLGDAQIFSKSALYNCDLGAFYTKWLTDVEDAQYDFGPYANFAPRPYPDLVWYSPGWMEAGIMIPYNVYKFYGDTRIIREHYASMTKFIDFHIVKTEGKYFYPENSWDEIGPKGGFGDWLSLTEKNLAHDLMASIYFANAVRLMAEMSKAIGEEKKAEYYTTIFEQATRNFVEHYMDEQGRLRIDEAAYGDGEGYFEGEKGFTGHTQAAYASAIYFDILPDELEKKAAAHLVELVKKANGKPTAGILGIRQLLPSLSKIGESEVAYQLLLNKEYPGWGFEVANGATTIWERWNSYTHEKGFNGEMNAKMNSFNHYAFGAVSEYLFSDMAGIDTQDAGFNEIIIRPDYGDKSIKHVRAEYHSINGKITSAWELKDSLFYLSVEIPVNTTAKIFLPVTEQQSTRGGEGSMQDEEVTFLGREGRHEVYAVGSGTYSFTSEL